MDFGRPNAEIGRKMANGRLLFLALQKEYIAMALSTVDNMGQGNKILGHFLINTSMQLFSMRKRIHKLAISQCWLDTLNL